MEKKKLTVVEKFEDAISLLNGETAEHGLTVEQAVEFLQERMAQTIKKNASGSKADRKPTATQIANEGVKEQILGVLASADHAMNATEVGKALGIESNQKIANLLTQLKKSGAVIRDEVKGRAVFSIAEPCAESEDAE